MDAFCDDNGNGQWDLKFGHFLGFGFLNMWLEREGEWHLFGLVPLCISLLPFLFSIVKIEVNRPTFLSPTPH